MHQEPVLVVFSHLPWNFVYQRPQHLLSRFAVKRRVLYIEEPSFDRAAEPSWEKTTPVDNVSVCRPRTCMRSPGYSDEQMPALRVLVERLLEEEQVKDYLLWFYTPMALPLAHGLQPRTIIYDCMDELSAFLHAPPQLLAREAELLKSADLVFTG